VVYYVACGGSVVPSSDSCIEVPPSGLQKVIVFGDMVFKDVIMLTRGTLIHYDWCVC